MTEYRIYVVAEKNFRTINTPANGRVNYDVKKVIGNRADLKAKVLELQAAGIEIDEIRYGCGGNKIYLFEL